MNRIAVAKELVAIAKILNAKDVRAGNTFSSYFKAAKNGLGDAETNLRQMGNHISYKISGDGFKSDVTGERSTTESQRKAAKEVDERIGEARNAVEEAFKALKNIEKDVALLDSFDWFY